MKIIKGLEKAITFVVIIDACILIAMLIMIVVDIVWRLFGGSVKGSVELVTMTVPVIVFLGVGYTMSKEMHVRVDVFKVAWFDRICNVICIAFMILIGYMTTTLTIQTKSLGTSSTILHIPRWPYIMITAIGFFMVALALILNEIKYYINKHNMKHGIISEDISSETKTGIEE